MTASLEEASSDQTFQWCLIGKQLTGALPCFALL